MKNKFLGFDGFSLVEVLVAAALLGVLAMAIIQQMQIVDKSKRDISERAIINNLIDKLSVELARQETCTANFGGLNITNSSITASIKAADGSEIIKVGNSYGGKSLAADPSMSAANANLITVAQIATKPNPTNANELLLVVTFNKKSIFEDLPSIELPLNYIAETSNPLLIKHCFNDITTSIVSAVRLACKGNAVKYQSPADFPPYGRCVSDSIQTVCGTGEFLKKIQIDPATKKLKGTCTPIAVTSCPANKVITGFNSDGTVNCGDPLPSCPAGQIMIKSGVGGPYTCINTDVGCATRFAIQKFKTDGSGQILCSPYYPPQTCATFVQSISPTGISCQGGFVKPITCGPMQFITSFDSSGQPQCSNWATVPQSCGVQGMTGFDSSGNIKCQSLLRRLSCSGSYSPNGKTFNDCTADGGVVVNRNGGTNSFCVFSKATCPASYSSCNDYGNSAGTVSCKDTHSACSHSVQTRYATGTGIFQSPYWGAQKTAYCYFWARDSGPWVNSCTQMVGPQKTTPVTEVGCY
jgi:prepilin-type N-terminal cleavage/methylation domain-containing protein